MKQKFAKMLLEHDRGLIHLTFLNDAVDRIMTNGINSQDIKVLNDSVDYLLKEVKGHCKAEEDEIYPDLLQYTAENIIMEIRGEHYLIWKLVDEFKVFLNEIDNNQNEKTLRTILKVKSKLLIDILSNHIKKENNLLYNVAQQIFPERDFNNLCKSRKVYV